MVQPHCLPEDRKLAVYLVDDVLEHCEPARAHLDTFVPLLLVRPLSSQAYEIFYIDLILYFKINCT